MKTVTFISMTVEVTGIHIYRKGVNYLYVFQDSRV